MKRIILVSFLVSAFMVFGDEKADKIAKKFFDLKESNDMYSVVNMTIIDKNKNQKIRKVELYSRKDQQRGGVSDMFIRFIEPADVKNTKFLVIGNKAGDDEQRIYLPALKKTRKISSNDKSGKFVGSDLFYYDMENKDFEDFTYKFISEKTQAKEDFFKHMKFYVLEQVSKDSNAPYSKSVTYQNMDDNFVYKTEAYDKNGVLWKTVYIMKVEIKEGIIIPLDTLIVNHKDNSKTRLQVTDFKLNSNLDKNIFTIQNLEK